MSENFSTGNVPQRTNTERQLLVKILNATNAGGGGGSSAGIPTGNYGGGQPNFTPTTAGAIAIDSSNGRQWQWYNNSWN